MSVRAALPTTSNEKTASPDLRLNFLDGMRGLAALYIVLYHVGHERNSLSGLARHAVNWMRYGHFAVDVFIVISGYCLMLPIARSVDGKMRHGLKRFFQRRALRILPAYYAAFLLAAALVLVRHPHDVGSSVQHTLAMAPSNLVAHLFLFENLRSNWYFSINPVLWSVALEWQIYFLFPLVLLPLWRRFGTAAIVAGATILGLAPHLLMPYRYNLDCTAPWLLGLFVLGMAGAVIGHSNRSLETAWRERAPWGTMTLALFAVFWSILTFAPDLSRYRIGLTLIGIDLLVGAISFCFILYCTRAAAQAQASPSRRPLALRLLETRAVTLLGAFSYSLYLVHLPAWWMVHPIAHAMRLSHVATFAFQMIVGMPFCLVFSYLFYLIIERRFLLARQKPVPIDLDKAVVNAYVAPGVPGVEDTDWVNVTSWRWLRRQIARCAGGSGLSDQDRA